MCLVARASARCLFVCLPFCSVAVLLFWCGCGVLVCCGFVVVLRSDVSVAWLFAVLLFYCSVV